MFRSLLVLLVLSAAACGGNRNAGNNNTNPGDSAAPGDELIAGDPGPQCLPNQIVNGHGVCVTTCHATADCHDANLVCNLDLGVCIPKPPECDPTTCQDGYTCPVPGTGVTCIPLPEGACNVDGDCGILERCADGQCISRAGDVVQTCTADGDCPLLMTCQLGVCIGCLDDLQCQIGQSNPSAKCVVGTCVTADLGAPGECINKTCADGEVCALTTGECTKKCTVETEATDCTVDQRCLPLANYCVAEFGCTTTADCVGGDTGGLTCVSTCTSGSANCTGLCVGCTGNEQCLTGETCVQPTTLLPGACFPNLTGNACDNITCATPGDICDPANGSCYPENGTCVDATDCRPGYSCNFLHLCAGCTVDGDCRANQRCLLSTCIPIPSGG